MSKEEQPTTNDPRAEYGEQPKREPLLSDDGILSLSTDMDVSELSWWEHGAKSVRDFYEAKITSGELITKEEHERLVLQAIQDHEASQQGMD